MMDENQDHRVNSWNDNTMSLATFLQAFVVELYVVNLDASVLSLYTGKQI